jgi:hypothetical protein
VELDAGLFLLVADDAEEVAGLRIAARTEHANEALRLRAGRLAKLLETDGRLDVFANVLSRSSKKQQPAACIFKRRNKLADALLFESGP